MDIDSVVLLDVIRIPSRASDREALRNAARSYLAANLKAMGLRTFEKDRIKLTGDCKTRAELIGNKRIVELSELDERREGGRDWLRNLVVRHGVWSAQGAPSGVSATQFFTGDTATEQTASASSANNSPGVQGAPKQPTSSNATQKTDPKPTQDAVAQAGAIFDQGNAIGALEILETATARGDYVARMALINFFEIKVRMSSGWMMKPPDALHRHVAQLQESANAGNAFSTTLLGMVYQSGIGDIGKDMKRAVMLYEDAAKRGNTLAMVMLGRLYDFKGQPEINKDEARARQWYGQAIAAGDAHGMYNMSTLYPDDARNPEAKQLVYRAAELRFPGALQRLTECASEECASFARKEADMAIPHGLAYQTFFGANPARTYADAKAMCDAEERYALDHEWTFFWDISYSDRNSLFYLEHCVTKFGYLPKPSIRNWMLQMKNVNRDNKNVSLLTKYFALEDFDEANYPFTHQDRINHVDDIAKALDKATISGLSLGSGASESDYYPQDCFKELRNVANANGSGGFFTNQADLMNYVNAEGNYVNCLYRYMQSFANFDHATQIRKVIPGYYYLTTKEQRTVEERIYEAARYFPRKTLEEIKETDARAKRRIDESVGVMRDIERSRAQNRAEWNATIGNLVQQINTYAEQMRPPPPPDLAEFNRIVAAQERSKPTGGGRINTPGGASAGRIGTPSGEAGNAEKQEKQTQASSSQTGADADTCYYFATIALHRDKPIYEVQDTVTVLDVVAVDRKNAQLMGLGNAASAFFKSRMSYFGVLDTVVSNDDIYIGGGCTKDSTRAEVEKLRTKRFRELNDRQGNLSWVKYVDIVHGNWFGR